MRVHDDTDASGPLGSADTDRDRVQDAESRGMMAPVFHAARR